MRRTLNVSFKFLNKWSNKVEDLVFSQYVLNRIFPSWSKAVPSVLRSSLAEFALCYSTIASYNFNSIFYNQIVKLHEHFIERYSPFVYYCTIPLCEVPKEAKPSSVGLEERCFRLSTIIFKIGERINFKEAQEIADKEDISSPNSFYIINPLTLERVPITHDELSDLVPPANFSDEDLEHIREFEGFLNSFMAKYPVFSERWSSFLKSYESKYNSKNS